MLLLITARTSFKFIKWHIAIKCIELYSLCFWWLCVAVTYLNGQSNCFLFELIKRDCNHESIGDMGFAIVLELCSYHWGVNFDKNFMNILLASRLPALKVWEKCTLKHKLENNFIATVHFCKGCNKLYPYVNLIESPLCPALTSRSNIKDFQFIGGENYVLTFSQPVTAYVKHYIPGFFFLVNADVNKSGRKCQLFEGIQIMQQECLKKYFYFLKCIGFNSLNVLYARQ